MTEPIPMNLILKDTAFGKGVFAGEAITAGTMILRFSGPHLRYAQTTAETYALQIDTDLYIGASGELDDYVNHSCDPNAGIRIEGTDVTLIAIRDIAPGEEIAFDYSTVMAEDDFEMRCMCGRSCCRGLIRDGKHLPEATWRRYLDLGILPRHVRNSRADQRM